jgi:hypothetical protein
MKTKLTMVSVQTKKGYVTRFVQLPVVECNRLHQRDIKVRVSSDFICDMVPKVNGLGSLFRFG